MPIKKKKYIDFEPKAFNQILDKNLKGCTVQYHPVFVFIEPNNPKLREAKNIKANFNKKRQLDYSYSERMKELRKDDDLTNQARKKLRRNDIWPVQKYENNAASLKMHISLNNIGSLDQKLIVELLAMLNDEAVDPNNQLGFTFKIVRPEFLKNPEDSERFSMNDQITVYFDKYSATGAMINLAKKVEMFLKKHNVPDNEKKTGLKDKISLNSFVSLRYDNNKLEQYYGEFPFFDLEIQKFLSRHQTAEFADLPLFAFEKIFIDLILSQSINNLREGPDGEQGLNEEDSKKLQQRFDMALKDPNYIFTNNPTSSPTNSPTNNIPQEKPTPSNPKLAAMIAVLNVKSADDDMQVHAILKPVAIELESLSKAGLSAAEENIRVEQIIKTGLNNAIRSPNGFSAVKVFENILQIQSKASNETPINSSAKDYRADPLLKILPAPTQVPSNSKVTEMIKLLKADRDEDNNQVQSLLNSVIKELEGLSVEKTSVSDKDIRAEQILKGALNKAILMAGGSSACELITKVLKTQIPPPEGSSMKMK